MSKLVFALALVLLVSSSTARAEGDDKKDDAGKDQAPIVDLAQWKARKADKTMYQAFADALQQLKEMAPPTVDHSDFYRKALENALSDRLEKLSSWRDDSVSFAQVRKALAIIEKPDFFVERDLKRLSDADRALAVENFLRLAMEHVEGGASVKDVVAVDRHLRSESAHTGLFHYAIGGSRTRGQARELFARAVGNASFSLDRAAVEQLFTHVFGITSTDSDSFYDEAKLLESIVRERVLERVEADYDRALLLRHLEPLLARYVDSAALDAMVDVANAPWLPFDISGVARRIVTRWESTGLLRKRGLRAELDGPAPRKPWRVCAALLLGSAVKSLGSPTIR